MGDGERTHKKTGVLAAISFVVEMLTALLSIGESARRLFDQSCLRVEVKSSQGEEAWDASETARIETRRERGP